MFSSSGLGLISKPIVYIFSISLSLSLFSPRYPIYRPCFLRRLRHRPWARLDLSRESLPQGRRLLERILLQRGYQVLLQTVEKKNW